MPSIEAIPDSLLPHTWNSLVNKYLPEALKLEGSHDLLAFQDATAPRLHYENSTKFCSRNAPLWYLVSGEGTLYWSSSSSVEGLELAEAQEKFPDAFQSVPTAVSGSLLVIPEPNMQYLLWVNDLVL